MKSLKWFVTVPLAGVLCGAVIAVGIALQNIPIVGLGVCSFCVQWFMLGRSET